MSIARLPLFAAPEHRRIRKNLIARRALLCYTILVPRNQLAANLVMSCLSSLFPRLASLGLLLLIAHCPALAQSSITISEFQASNRGTLADGNGDYSDWIEIQNSGEVT